MKTKFYVRMVEGCMVVTESEALLGMNWIRKFDTLAEANDFCDNSRSYIVSGYWNGDKQNTDFYLVYALGAVDACSQIAKLDNGFTPVIADREIP